MTKTAKILWVDLEMTGLDPIDDSILEVAAIATDWDFNELDVMEGVVSIDNDLLEKRIENNSSFWNLNPMAREGLMSQNKHGKSSQKVAGDLIKFIEKNFGEKTDVLLAGNSIHIDRQFIDKQWPSVAEKLHYRMLDVSAWKVVFDGKFKKKFAKPQDHRALGDIRGSIMELKYYLSKMK